MKVAILTKFGRVATVMNDQDPQSIREEVSIPAELAGERVDKAAAQLLSDYSRAELTRWLGEGSLTIDGSVVKPKHKVFGGERLMLSAQRQSREDWHAAQDIALDVLFEDDDLLVLNKPAGLVVHPGAGNADGTLVNALLHHRPDLSQLARAGIVHRLDKDTSGIMVVAASPLAYQRLVLAISERFLLQAGSLGPPWVPWAPWAPLGPSGPPGAQGLCGYLHNQQSPCCCCCLC